MTTFPAISGLSEPVDGDRIPVATVSYITARNRRHLFEMIQTEFVKSGITQAQLCARMGKGSDRISRLLGQPANLTADTAAEILFAMSGGEIQYHVTYPVNRRSMPKPSSSMVVINSEISQLTVWTPVNVAVALPQPTGRTLTPIGTVAATSIPKIETREAA